MKKLILILLVLSGCNKITSNEAASSRLTYFKDARTGLCFAQILSTTKDGWQVVSISTVPCKEVENHLMK